jgi:hypothetical protein
MNDEPQIFFAIEIPSVSHGLKRTYKKKIEVFEVIISSTYKGDSVHKFSSHIKHEYFTKTNKWVMSNYSHFHGSARIEKDIVEKSVNKILIFDDIGKAIISKILLIKDMGLRYERELISLQESYDKNVPRVENVLLDMQNKFPEHFL